jgi:hypothetical protein
MVASLDTGGEDMAATDRRALVDLTGIDLNALCPAEGSVLDEALARVRGEEGQDGWGYASFLNELHPDRNSGADSQTHTDGKSEGRE